MTVLVTKTRFRKTATLIQSYVKPFNMSFINVSKMLVIAVGNMQFTIGRHMLFTIVTNMLFIVGGQDIIPSSQ